MEGKVTVSVSDNPAFNDSITTEGESVVAQSNPKGALPLSKTSFMRGRSTSKASETELSRLMRELVPPMPDEQAPVQVVDPNEDVVDFGKMSIPGALKRLDVTEKDGLTSQQVEERIQQYGLNALPDGKENECLKFLSFAWNPLSWVMESAALVSIILSNGPTPWLCSSADLGCTTTNAAPDWEDFLGIIILLFLNSTIGYYEENQAGKAVGKLMDQLTREYKVKRDGQWTTVETKYLVPGDIITIKLGDVIPADCKLLDAEPMKIDQSALTGESLPSTKYPGNEIYSGSLVKQGEAEALVYATGLNTFFGKAANLVATTQGHGHLQQVLTRIGFFCMSYITTWMFILLGVLYGYHHFDYRRGIDMVLVILIGGVPIAMPTVLSVTMAIGVNELAKERAVVTRITAVEELAGMDILCSDKTGTLTLNHLTVRDPSVCAPFTTQDVLTCAALAARRHGDPDAIDRCIVESLPKDDQEMLNTGYEVLKFVPFDPVSKRTEATVVDKRSGKRFLCSKGAPQIIINLAHNADAIRDEQNRIIAEYAVRGLRAIGVARCDDGTKWTFMGLISLSDPPRPDTKATIHAAMALGVRVVMITGDQIAIGKETARELGMGLNFHAASILKNEFVDHVPIMQVIEESQGWGEVMPEDKYKVVQGLRANGHIVGMTGDGVNDAPALKVADVGIAVAGATDAARGAADMVLLDEGLSVIIKAMIGSRCIFQRMRNYATYACATTIRIVTTFSLLSLIWQFTFSPFLVLIIAILNDGTIMTVSTDRVQPSRRPDSWRLRNIFVNAIILGLYLSVSSIVFFWLILDTDFFEDRFDLPAITYNETNPIDLPSKQLSGIMYLQVSITGQLIIFTTRARTWFFLNRPSNFLMSAFVVAQIVATMIAVYAGWDFAGLGPIGWPWALAVWVWSLIWILPMDIPKMLANSLLEEHNTVFSFKHAFERTFNSELNKKGLGAHVNNPRGSVSYSGQGVINQRPSHNSISYQKRPEMV
jgi:H+-transporting ATPase